MPLVSPSRLAPTEVIAQTIHIRREHACACADGLVVLPAISAFSRWIFVKSVACVIVPGESLPSLYRCQLTFIPSSARRSSYP